MPIKADFVRSKPFALERPSCPKCHAGMMLVRISPVPNSAPLRVERTFECQCGATLGIEEPIVSGEPPR